MSKKHPVVSIIMPVYNAALYLKDAIDSIIRQTLPDFELIAIDDGSTDDSPAILRSYTDTRIVHLTNASNQGIVKTLNRGLSVASGTFIARMDADDIALPLRLEKQVAFLTQNPHIGLVSSNTIRMDESGNLLNRGKPHRIEGASPDYVRWRLMWGNPLSHPTIMMRRQLLIDHQLSYDESAKAIEDYDLWIRISQHTDIMLLKEAYLLYRVHGESISRSQTSIQQKNGALWAMKHIRHVANVDIPDRVLELLVYSAREQANDLTVNIAPNDVKAACDLLITLYNDFAKQVQSSQTHNRILWDVVKYLISIARYTGQMRTIARAFWQLRSPRLGVASIVFPLKKIIQTIDRRFF